MAAESGLEGAGVSEAARRPGARPDRSSRVEHDAAGGTATPGEPDPGQGQEADEAGAAADADLAAALRFVEHALRTEPHPFGFFQSVRLLERLRPARGQVGRFEVEPAREVVRFGVNPALAFPASEIQSLELPEDGAQPSMKVNFMGLIGPQGVMPYPYSLLVGDRLRARDPALADFLDIFHHRLISLFYQAWRRYRFTIAREDGEDDRLAEHLGDLIGLGLDTTRERLPVPDEALIQRAGLLAGLPRGAVALQQLLGDLFDVPAAVEEFVGGWYPIEDADRCAVGEEDGDASRLGLGSVAGDEVWDQQARVRIRLGPLDQDRFDAFLPGGSSHGALAAVLRFFSHDQFDFEVQLVLARDHVTGLRLGRTTGGTQQLGWSTWICATTPRRDADETVLTLLTRAAS